MSVSKEPLMRPLSIYFCRTKYDCLSEENTQKSNVDYLYSIYAMYMQNLDISKYLLMSQKFIVVGLNIYLP